MRIFLSLILILVFASGAFLGELAGEFLDFRKIQAVAIERHCAEYSSTTGHFQWASVVPPVAEDQLDAPPKHKPIGGAK